jgi:hypothetical protein
VVARAELRKRVIVMRQTLIKELSAVRAPECPPAISPHQANRRR